MPATRFPQPYARSQTLRAKRCKPHARNRMPALLGTPLTARARAGELARHAAGGGLGGGAGGGGARRGVAQALRARRERRDARHRCRAGPTDDQNRRVGSPARPPSDRDRSVDEPDMCGMHGVPFRRLDSSHLPDLLSSQSLGGFCKSPLLLNHAGTLHESLAHSAWSSTLQVHPCVVGTFF